MRRRAEARKTLEAVVTSLESGAPIPRCDGGLRWPVLVCARTPELRRATYRLPEGRPHEEDPITDATAAPPKQASDKTAIRPFQVDTPEAELTELRRRIKATRLPERETVSDNSQGVPLPTVQRLARYWGEEYDWRKCEARLKAVPILHHRDRRAGHSLHPRALEVRECPAGDHHPRLARIGARAAVVTPRSCLLRRPRRSTSRRVARWGEPI